MTKIKCFQHFFWPLYLYFPNSPPISHSTLRNKALLISTKRKMFCYAALQKGIKSSSYTAVKALSLHYKISRLIPVAYN
jgi:hypothetical protein